MNCRRVSGLLSAYLDAELTGVQMLEIGEHLDKCPACRREFAGLQETKHLLGALSMQAPRAEFDALLRSECEQAARPASERLMEWVLAWRGGALTLPRPRPLVAAAGLSLGAILLATSTTSVSTDVAEYTAVSEPVPAYVSVVQPDVFPASMQVNEPDSLILTGSTSVVWPVSAPEYPYALTQAINTPQR